MIVCTTMHFGGRDGIWNCAEEALLGGSTAAGVQKVVTKKTPGQPPGSEDLLVSW